MLNACGLVVRRVRLAIRQAWDCDHESISQDLQAIVSQGGAGGDQVNDQVGVTDGRGNLQRAFGKDQLDIWHAMLGKESPAQVGEFGGDAQRASQMAGETRQVCHRIHALPGFWNDHVQRAMPESQARMDDQDIAILAAPLCDYIPAGDAEVHAAFPHADDDIAGSLEEHRQTRQARDGGAVLARVGLVHMQPHICQQLERCFGQNAFTGQA